MKKFLLSVVLLGSVLTSYAQSGGYSVSPIGATPNDQITLTVDPAVACPDGGPGLADPAVQIVRLHGGVAVGGSRWQAVVGADGTNDATVGFTQNPNGTWSKTFTPATYFSAATGTIEELCFVLNGGSPANVWTNKGNYQDPATSTCGDVFIPFPIASPFGVTSIKKSQNTAFAIRSTFPNPANDASSIRFTVKQAGVVSVSVKNMLGQTVATLANGFMTAGDKTFTFNVNSNPSGIYFFTVESAGHMASSKFNVIK
jgi:hypothetical protein